MFPVAGPSAPALRVQSRFRCFPFFPGSVYSVTNSNMLFSTLLLAAASVVDTRASHPATTRNSSANSGTLPSSLPQQISTQRSTMPASTKLALSSTSRTRTRPVRLAYSRPSCARGSRSRRERLPCLSGRCGCRTLRRPGSACLDAGNGAPGGGCESLPCFFESPWLNVASFLDARSDMSFPAIDYRLASPVQMTVR